MHIDFRTFSAWSELNENVAEKLGVDLDKTVVRNYQGVGHALIEVCLGVAKLFPLKKKIYYFKDMNPYFEGALLPLAKEGYKLMALDLEVLQSPEAWLATLSREDLFVLYGVDEPLLSRGYDLKIFESALKDKSIFKIRLSHGRHFYEFDTWRSSPVLEKNMALIYGISPTEALSLIGERGKIGALTANQLMYFHEPEITWFKTPVPLDAKKIMQFESCHVADFKSYFSPHDLRIYDRAVIYWTDMDGHAVIDRLAKKLDFQLQPAGLENRLETTSLSRWGGVRTMNFLKAWGYSPEMIRGTVIISHKLVDLGDKLVKALTEARESILHDQLGD